MFATFADGIWNGIGWEKNALVAAPLAFQLFSPNLKLAAAGVAERPTL
jgi:hypothetical protein